MKLVLVLALALFSANAQAYTSASGNDPALGSYDAEVKVAVKSVTATYSDAISRGHALYYTEGELTGLYTVSRYYSVGDGSAATASKWIACIAARAVATGDTAGFPCVTKGYVDYALYSAVTTTAPIALGAYLCVGNTDTIRGRLVGCASGVTSPIIALEAKTTTGSGTIKVMIQNK